jgi:nitric oxide reductase NorQ protein
MPSSPNQDLLKTHIRTRQSAEVDLAIALADAKKHQWEKELGFRSFSALVSSLGLKPAQAKNWTNTIRLLEQAEIPTELARRLGMENACLLTDKIEFLLAREKPREMIIALLHLASSMTSAEVKNLLLPKFEMDYAAGRIGQPSASTTTYTIGSGTVPVTFSEKSKVLSGLVSQILRGKNRFPAPPSDFLVDTKVWQQLTFSVQAEVHCMLIGPAGCGKTELIHKLGHECKRSVHSFSFGAMSEARTSLIGSTQFAPETGTFFVESRFTQAIQTRDAIVLLDEFNRCQPDASNLLIPVLDGQRYISIDETGKTCHVANGVVFIATMNVGHEYSGTSIMDRAVKDRFGIVIDMHYPTIEQETELLMKRYRGLSRTEVWKIASIAAQQRKLASAGEFECAISTRMLLSTVQQLSFGFSLQDAIEFTIVGHFSSDGDQLSDRRRLRQLIQKYV